MEIMDKRCVSINKRSNIHPAMDYLFNLKIILF